MDRLRRFATLLLGWNRGVSNLISRNDEARIVERHLRESIEPAHWLKEHHASRWIDFGSGAGFPAIPLAILGVGEKWTLVESRRPKTLFMRKAILELELSGIEVYHGRLENLIEEAAGARIYDAFSSRATLRLAPTLELAGSIVKKGGTAFLWKGSRHRDELLASSSWSDAWELDRTMEIGSENISMVKFNRIN